MTEQSRTVLKSYFQRGNRPTQSQYEDLIDSFALVAASGSGSTLTSAQVVMRTGDTMTGLLILSGNPAVANGAATKTYVDTADALKMTKSTYDAANISEQVIGVSASQSMYNKSLIDTSTLFVNAANTTKKFLMDCSAISVSATRIGQVPDASGFFALITANTLAASGSMTLSNGLTLKWGNWTSDGTTGNPVAVSFSSAFTTSLYALVLGGNGASTTPNTAWFDNPSISGFNGRAVALSTTCYYFAIGI